MESKLLIIEKGGFVYDAPTYLPYHPFRRDLYSWQELLAESRANTSCDLDIYQHFSTSRFNPNINEALWQRMHDHAIDDALREFIGMRKDGMPMRPCVGIMGGHSTHRSHVNYQHVAKLAKTLSEAGYFIASGGGPGIMEAANLGAFFSGKPDCDLEKALEILTAAPHYADTNYHNKALEVLDTFPSDAQSLAIPTWFYGHEPSNIFATHIAKYFSNSIREDTLLAICLSGVVFAEGSAGTWQEIFMDLAQNYYKTYGYQSPMILFGSAYSQKHKSIVNSVFDLLKDHSLKNYISVTEQVEEVLSFIERSLSPGRK